MKPGYQPSVHEREERRERWQGYVGLHPEMNRKEVRKAPELRLLLENDFFHTRCQVRLKRPYKS